MNHSLSETAIAKVQDVLMEKLNVTREQILPEAAIMADLGADSLDVVEITMALEEQFDVTFSDEEVERADTVAELYSVLAAVMGRARCPV
jgi:acyl carrier protein